MRFESYHPFLNLMFFAAVIAFTVWWTHPAFLGVSFACAFAYSVKLRGVRALALNLALVAFALLWGAWFATHTHFGVTPLGSTLIGNDVTLEALAFGVVQGFMLASVVMWLQCAIAVFTADKVVYLLGRVSPRLALMIAIALRAVPVVADRGRRIGVAQRGVGAGVGQGSVPRRVVHVVHHTSALVTWSADRFMEMAESMKSRGSRLRGRTAFSLYRFDSRDRLLVVFLVALITVCADAAAFGQTFVLYSPEIIVGRCTAATFVFLGAYFTLCVMPLALELVGEARFAMERRAL